MVNTDEKQGMRITEFRKMKRLTQSDLAKVLECSQPNLNKLESGSIGISSSMRRKLFKKFPELNSLWLETGMGKMMSEQMNIPDLSEVSEQTISTNSQKMMSSLSRFEKMMSEGKIPFDAVISIFQDLRKIIQIQESRIQDLEDDKAFLKTIIVGSKDSPFAKQ